jgi:hypothetical protein
MTIVNKFTMSIRLVVTAVTTIMVATILDPLSALAATNPGTSSISNAVYQYGGELNAEPTLSAATRTAIGFVIAGVFILAVIGTILLLRRRRSK